MKTILCLLLGLSLLASDVYARGGHGAPRGGGSRLSHRRADGVARDRNGRIARSSQARHDFMTRTGYPHGRKGYVIDHIIPLKRGGKDEPSNMQWQTIAESKAKDKTE